MKPWPQSLLWRTVLLLALLMVASQLVWFSFVRHLDREPRARQLAKQAVSIVLLTRTALLAVPPQNRRFFLTELDRQQGIRVYPAFPGDAAGREPGAPFARLLAHEIRGRLGSDTQIAFGRRGIPGLWIRFKIEEDYYWMALPRVRAERAATPQLLIWGAISLGLALLGAWLIALSINRPVQALASAARQIGQGAQPAALGEAGPLELRELTRNFNQMNADLARLNRERTVMLAGISHDLRTPLARLRLAIEMLRETDPVIRDGMVEDIESMDAIIGQFLAFARGAEDEAPANTDLDQIVAEQVERYARGGKTVAAELGGPFELPLRPLAMQRLLSNLIDNAFHHGGTEVMVKTTRSAGNIVLSVLDRGQGIPPAAAAAALQPFARLNTARGGHAGAGLGLAIVQRIAQTHGGKLELLPREGGGLEARVTLPV